jgi:hypothetical protein
MYKFLYEVHKLQVLMICVRDMDEGPAHNKSPKSNHDNNPDSY